MFFLRKFGHVQISISRRIKFDNALEYLFYNIVKAPIFWDVIKFSNLSEALWNIEEERNRGMLHDKGLMLGHAVWSQ